MTRTGFPTGLIPLALPTPRAGQFAVRDFTQTAHPDGRPAPVPEEVPSRLRPRRPPVAAVLITRGDAPAFPGRQRQPSARHRRPEPTE